MRSFAKNYLDRGALDQLERNGYLTPAQQQKINARLNGGASGSAARVDNFIKNNVPADFQGSVRKAFAEDVKVTTLTEDLTVYRYYGKGVNPKSFWVTPNKYTNPASSLALPSVNSAENIATYIIPKGTTILEGTVAPNFGQQGGGYQIYIPDIFVLK